MNIVQIKRKEMDMKKIKNIIIMSLVLVWNGIVGHVGVLAKEPHFQADVANRVVMNNLITPIAGWMAAIIPIIAALACGIVYLKWLLKDEDEREQKPFGRPIRKILIGLGIVECIDVIILIFSL